MVQVTEKGRHVQQLTETSRKSPSPRWPATRDSLFKGMGGGEIRFAYKHIVSRDLTFHPYDLTGGKNLTEQVMGPGDTAIGGSDQGEGRREGVCKGRQVATGRVGVVSLSSPDATRW